MNAYATFLSLAIALIVALFLSATWTALAGEPETTAVTTVSPVAQTSPSHYQSFTERLQKQWHVNPLVADAHSLSSTGWGTAACAPRSPGFRQTMSGGGDDSLATCVQKCMKRTSLENPNGLLLCRSGCL